MPRSRLSAALYLLLVFASGILVGVIVHRLYTASSAIASTVPVIAAPRTPEEWRKRYLDTLRTRIGASEDQIGKITQVLDDTKRKFDDVHAEEKKVHDQMHQDQIAAIRDVLNTKQQAAFDVWRLERQREREKAEKK